MNRRSCSAFSRAALTLAVACVGHSSLVLADEAPAVRADQLFNEGKARMAGSDFAAACPLLAESFALDPATGALLALALCHEREGKLASAHYEYSQAAARSVAEGRKDREQAAREKIAALETRLSSLTIAVAATNAAAAVRVDGAPFDPALLGKPTPIDGGEHFVEVSAPQMKPWRTRIVIGSSADAKTVLVPALEPEPAVTIAAAAPLPPSAPAPRKKGPKATRQSRRTDSTPSATEWLGIGTIVAGLAGVGAGTYFAIEAENQSDEAKSGCDRDVCTTKAAQARIDSTSAQNASALSFVIGGLLATTGLAIYLAHASSSSSEAATASSLTATAWAAPDGAGAVVRGGF